MDTTIRNLDDSAYRALKARAALEQRSIGELVSDAIRQYLVRPIPAVAPVMRTVLGVIDMALWLLEGSYGSWE